MFPAEVWAQIFHIVVYDLCSGSIYKSLIFLSRQTQKVGYTFWKIAKNKLANHLLTILQTFPQHRTKMMIDVSKNPNITWKIIQDDISNYPENAFRWDWTDIMVNPNITLEIINSNPHNSYYWDMECFMQNRNASLEFIEANLHLFSIYVSSNKNLTLDFIVKHINLKWNWDRIQQNSNINKEIIQHNLSITSLKDWNILIINNVYADWNYIAKHKLITWKIIQENFTTQRYWYGFSQNPNVTWKIIQDNLHLPWIHEGLVKNPNITWKIIENSNMFHEYFASYQRVDPTLIPEQEYQKHINILKSKDPNLTWEIVVANPNFTWDWYAMSTNKFTKSKKLSFSRLL